MRSSLLVLAAVATASLASVSSAQCVGFRPGFGFDPGNGLGSEVRALVVFDDGRGPALYAGGTFFRAGIQPTNYVARWDGTSWEALGSPTALGGVGAVNALVVHNDGSGTALFVGGTFRQSAGAPANGLAKWNGAAWSGVGSIASLSGSVTAMTIHDDGTGPALVVAGGLESADSLQLSNVAQWKGGAWSAVGDARSGSSLSAVDTVRQRIVSFSNGETVEFDGVSWRVRGPAPAVRNASVTASAGMAYDPIRQRTVLLGGGAQNNGDEGQTWEWDGSTWTLRTNFGPKVRRDASMAFDPNLGKVILFGGRDDYWNRDGFAETWAWDGVAGSWSLLTTAGPSARYDAPIATDTSRGRIVLVGGSEGSNYVRDTWEWNGTAWTRVSLNVGPTRAANAAMAFDPVAGHCVLFGDALSLSPSTWAWNGTAWSILNNSGPSPRSGALAGYLSSVGKTILFAGNVPGFGGTAESWGWNGSAWSAISRGPFNQNIYAIASHNDGSGPAIYIGGALNSQGTLPLANVAAFRNGTWSPVGSGFDGTFSGTINSFSQLTEAGVPRLFAAGEFSNSGGVPTGPLARWDGTAWSAVGVPVSGTPGRLLGQADFGAGPRLVAKLPGTSFLHLWDGSSWSTLAPQVPDSDAIFALARYDAGETSWYLGGAFFSVDSNPSLPSRNLARLAPCVPPGIQTQPQSAFAEFGVVARFSVSPTGTGPFSYLWRHNGVPLANSIRVTGADSASLQIYHWIPADEGTYDVVVSNGAGQVTSNPAVFTVDRAGGSPVEIEPVVLPTTPVPWRPGFTFFQASEASVSGDGDFSFRYIASDLLNGGGQFVNGFGHFSAGTFTRLAEQNGDPAPGCNPNEFYVGFERARVGNGGSASWSGDVGGQRLGGLWARDASGVTSLIAKRGNAVPGVPGSIYRDSSFHFAMNAGGSVAYVTVISGQPDVYALFLREPGQNAQLIVREGGFLPGTSQVCTDFNSVQPAIDSDGSVYMKLFVDGVPGLWRFNQGVSTKIVQTGDQAVGLPVGSTVEGPGIGWAIGPNGEVTFPGIERRANNSFRSGLFRWSQGVITSLFADGTPVPDSGPGSIFWLPEVLGDVSGNVFFSGQVIGCTQDCATTGVWRLNPQGLIESIAVNPFVPLPGTPPFGTAIAGGGPFDSLPRGLIGGAVTSRMTSHLSRGASYLWTAPSGIVPFMLPGTQLIFPDGVTRSIEVSRFEAYQLGVGVSQSSCVGPDGYIYFTANYFDGQAQVKAILRANPAAFSRAFYPCLPDFNRDGFLDFFDYDSFVEAFEIGDLLADYNSDGFIDFFDYDGFVIDFEIGC